jgi:ketosteroid isomerase-like protein
MENDREESRIRTAIDQRTAARGGSLETWLSSLQGSVACAIHDLSITTADDEACGHGLLQISACNTDGHRIDTWVPATFCLRKVDGAWKVTNERAPLPFHAAERKAWAEAAF